MPDATPAEHPKGRPIVVILSTADYDAAVWTNKQHIASRLADYADVYYIDSLGLRRPSMTVADLRRLRSRLRTLVRRARKSSAHDTRSARPRNLRVLTPTVIPLHGSGLAGRINSRILRKALATVPLEAAVLWTFSPLTYGIEERARRIVYHSVDLLHTLPRVPSQALLKAEENLVLQADKVIASSSEVKTHLQRWGRTDVQLWPNVADVRIYTQAASNVRHRAASAVFAGNLTSSKVDFAMLRRVAERGVDLVLAGPVSVDGTRDARALQELLLDERVRYVGNLTPVELAELFARASVGLIPYHLNEYTRGVYPMKLWEYLAAGLSVVSVRLPSLVAEDMPGTVLVDSTSFDSAVLQAVEDFSTEGAQQRIAAAAGHSWETRMAQVYRLLQDVGT